jgi:hypothetical protein
MGSVTMYSHYDIFTSGFNSRPLPAAGFTFPFHVLDELVVGSRAEEFGGFR